MECCAVIKRVTAIDLDKLPVNYILWEKIEKYVIIKTCFCKMSKYYSFLRMYFWLCIHEKKSEMVESYLDG